MPRGVGNQSGIRGSPLHHRQRLFQKGRVDEAIAEYSKRPANQTLYMEAHFNLGIALGPNGKEQEAIDNFEKALNLRPAMG